MKVKLSVEIELTEEQMREYADEYGLAATATAVATDLRDNVSSGLQDSLIGEFATVTVKRSR